MRLGGNGGRGGDGGSKRFLANASAVAQAELTETRRVSRTLAVPSWRVGISREAEGPLKPSPEAV